jgi:hypothetical protein
MQRVADGLARYAQAVGELILANSTPRWKRVVADGVQQAPVDLINEPGSFLQWRHGTGVMGRFRIRNSEF